MTAGISLPMPYAFAWCRREYASWKNSQTHSRLSCRDP